ncbi:hypothetical protein [Exiguobacterium sp. NG55]|uniref:hypothetical protein n=1 Tax=Exiguobacterium sp. NG55 TaxID=375477 RepID=UPI0004DF337E|nr:hypothetical protein [Exiguobacterium sp. NG55]
MIYLRRKHEIRQSDGLNQIAFVNSHNNEVTIINEPKEYVSLLIQKGKFQEAAGIISEICKQAEKLHPLYPLYVYKPVDFGGKTVFIHSPSTPEIAEIYPLQFKGELKIVDSDVRKGEKINDFLSRKYFSQQRVSIDITYMEAWIGEQIIKDDYSLEQNAITEGEWYILPDNLPDPVTAKLIIIADSEYVLIDYLELNITEYDKGKDTLVISNHLQKECPIEISLNLQFSMLEKQGDESKANFNIRIRENFEGTIKAEKILLEFLKFSSENIGVHFIDLKNSRTIFSAENITLNGEQDRKHLEDKIEFLSDLLLIEKKFDVKLKLPSSISEEDLENISILKAILKSERIIGTAKECSVFIDEKNTLNKMVNEVKTEELMIKFERDLSFIVFGVEFDKIKAHYQFTNLRVRNLEIIKNKIAYFQNGEVVKVEFYSDSKNNTLTTYNF